MDLWVMLDGTNTVEDLEFYNLTAFLSDFADKFSISALKVKMGLSIFPYQNDHYFFFNETVDVESFQNHLSTITKPDLRKLGQVKILFNLVISK